MSVPASAKEFEELQAKVEKLTKFANQVNKDSADLEKSQDKQIEYNKKRLDGLSKKVDVLEKAGKGR